jgi:hypothetical protein
MASPLSGVVLVLAGWLLDAGKPGCLMQRPPDYAVLPDITEAAWV